MIKIAVGLSGGVDSSVAALLLKKKGYDVIGLFMKNWEDAECSANTDFEDVAKVCKQIDIPYYSINFVEEYKKYVFDSFLEDCKKGLTPNPDILCNKEIKFKLFFQKAKDLGADFLATGHYCQILKNQNQFYLLKGLDPLKDQSYFLGSIDGSILNKILFPIGHLPKSEVRKIAKENHLITFDKKDSTGICFIGKRNFKNFLKDFLGFQKGFMILENGEKVGMHDGLSYYTIGQRKGLNIGGKGDAWYVLKKDIKKNLLIVGQGENNPLLFAKKLFANTLHWICSIPTLPFNCSAKIRYRQEDQTCNVTSIQQDTVCVTFDLPQRAITPGQTIVFYQDTICLGSGKIIEIV